MHTPLLQQLQITLASSTDSRLSTSILEEIFTQRLFKLFIPRALGGLEMPFPQAVKLIEQVSQLDGSLGWCIQIGAGGGFFAQYFSPELCEEVVRQREFVIAGSGTPSGIGVTTKNGLKVTGAWRYCSGSDYASLFTAVTTRQDGSCTALSLMPDQVEVLRDWESVGMRSTSSHTIRCSDAEVAEYRLFLVGRRIQDFNYRVYDLPFETFAKALIFSVALGIAHSWTRLFGEASSNLHSEYPKLEQLFNKKQESLRTITERFYEILQITWETFCLTPEQEVDFSELRKAVILSTEQLFLDASELFFYSGMRAVENRESAIYRVWADLCTVVQHRMLKC